MIRNRVRVAVATVIATMTLAPLFALVTAAPASAAVRVELGHAEQAQLDLLNDYRRSHGLSTVSIDPRAQTQARAWTAHLARVGALQHSPDLRADCTQAHASCAAWAENIGYASTAERVFQLMSESPGHAANMRMAAKDGVPVRVGIGILRSGTRVYITQRFYRCPCQNDDLGRQLNDQRRADVAYGQALHRDLLSRPGGADEVDAVASPLAYGIDRRAVAEGIAFSDAWVGALVDAYYQATLERSPDAAGRRYWIDTIRAGTTPAKVAAHFYASDEYFHRLGSLDAWVGDLFSSLLERPATTSERRQWADAVRGGQPRAAVAHAIFQHRESRSLRVQGLYEELLDREPDGAGWAYWTDRLADGRDVQLAIDLVVSDEYAARAVQRFA